MPGLRENMTTPGVFRPHTTDRGVHLRSRGTTTHTEHHKPARHAVAREYRAMTPPPPETGDPS